MKLAWPAAALLLAACGDRTTWLGEQFTEGLPSVPAVAPTFFSRYEAEAAANTLTFPVQDLDDSNPTCPMDGVKEGANCASGGRSANHIMGRSPCQPPTSRTSYDSCENIGGGVTFNDVTVPVDGTYDVTWWYHCGADPGRPGPGQRVRRRHVRRARLRYRTQQWLPPAPD